MHQPLHPSPPPRQRKRSKARSANPGPAPAAASSRTAAAAAGEAPPEPTVLDVARSAMSSMPNADELFATTDFHGRQHKRKTDRYKKSGWSPGLIPALGITVESLLAEMRVQRERQLKLHRAAEAARRAVSVNAMLRAAKAFKGAGGPSSPSNKLVAAVGAAVLESRAATQSPDGDLSRSRSPSMSQSQHAHSIITAGGRSPTPTEGVGAVKSPRPPKPPHGGSRSSMSHSRRRSAAGVPPSGSASPIAGDGNTPSPDNQATAKPKRLVFGRSSSAGVGREMLDAAKARYQELLTDRRKLTACVRLQAWFRHNQFRWALRRTKRAQGRIAAVFSRCILKLIVRVRMKRRHRLLEAEARERDSHRRFTAARTIQCAARSWYARRATRDAQAERDVVLRGVVARERPSRSATVIALWYRTTKASNARLSKASARRDAQAADFEYRVSWHAHIRRARGHASRVKSAYDHAATVIQAAYRGHRVRCNRAQYFFLLRNRLPPIVSKGNADAMPFRAWMATIKAVERDRPCTSV
jgi:hypothetical protein